MRVAACDLGRGRALALRRRPEAWSPALVALRDARSSYAAIADFEGAVTVVPLETRTGPGAGSAASTPLGDPPGSGGWRRLAGDIRPGSRPRRYGATRVPIAGTPPPLLAAVLTCRLEGNPGATTSRVRALEEDNQHEGRGDRGGQRSCGPGISLSPAQPNQRPGDAGGQRPALVGHRAQAPTEAARTEPGLLPDERRQSHLEIIAPATFVDAAHAVRGWIPWGRREVSADAGVARPMGWVSVGGGPRRGGSSRRPSRARPWSRSGRSATRASSSSAPSLGSLRIPRDIDQDLAHRSVLHGSVGLGNALQREVVQG